MTDRLDEHQKRLEDLIDKLEREDCRPSQSVRDKPHSYSQTSAQVFFPPSHQVSSNLPSTSVNSGMNGKVLNLIAFVF